MYRPSPPVSMPVLDVYIVVTPNKDLSDLPAMGSRVEPALLFLSTLLTLEQSPAPEGYRAPEATAPKPTRCCGPVAQLTHRVASIGDASWSIIAAR